MSNIWNSKDYRLGKLVPSRKETYLLSSSEYWVEFLSSRKEANFQSKKEANLPVSLEWNANLLFIPF